MPGNACRAPRTKKAAQSRRTPKRKRDIGHESVWSRFGEPQRDSAFRAALTTRCSLSTELSVQITRPKLP
jgi:hypothetical protein